MRPWKNYNDIILMKTSSDKDLTMKGKGHIINLWYIFMLIGK